ncbi:MAG: hypothetical protein M3P48_07965, partial [Actinomycetota bacterium]|nr:hypothetical protein [Actinomycetota bacterium]
RRPAPARRGGVAIDPRPVARAAWPTGWDRTRPTRLQRTGEYLGLIEPSLAGASPKSRYDRSGRRVTSPRLGQDIDELRTRVAALEEALRRLR